VQSLQVSRLCCFVTGGRVSVPGNAQPVNTRLMHCTSNPAQLTWQGLYRSSDVGTTELAAFNAQCICSDYMYCCPVFCLCLQECALLQQGVPAAAPQSPQASLQEDCGEAGGRDSEGVEPAPAHCTA
jgi:hypothetical protein